MLDYRIMPAKIIFMLSILGCRVLLPAWVSEEALANDSRSRSMLLTWQENALSVVGPTTMETQWQANLLNNAIRKKM